MKGGILIFELFSRLDCYLALAMLVTCLNGQETSGGQTSHDDLVFNKLADIECRLKQVLDKCVSVDISSEKEPTICDSSTTSAPSTTSSLTSGTTTSSKCPENWKPFGKSCYLFNTTLVVNFTGAVEQCKASNSHLVHVDSSDENKFIKDNMLNSADSYWIGLGDEDKDGTWKWVGTDSAATFLDWGPGQPDNTQANVKCAFYVCWSASCEWYGAPCTYDSKFICEKEQF